MERRRSTILHAPGLDIPQYQTAVADHAAPAVADHAAPVHQVRFQQQTSANSAVADDESGVEPEDDSRSVGSISSVAGDTADSETSTDPAVAAKLRQLRRAPRTPMQGPRPVSSWANSEPEVGNFGLMFCNWGERATLAGQAHQRHQRAVADRQLLKSPAAVVVVAEASAQVEELLTAPPEDLDPHTESKLHSRSTHEHWVRRGNEKSSVLVAARKDVTHGVDVLLYDVNDDHPYREKKKTKWRGRG